MKTDYHIHTEFSCDSEAKMENYVKQALERDIRMLCFTDHVDLNPEDYGYNYYNVKKYFKASAYCQLLWDRQKSYHS